MKGKTKIGQGFPDAAMNNLNRRSSNSNEDKENIDPYKPRTREDFPEDDPHRNHYPPLAEMSTVQGVNHDLDSCIGPKKIPDYANKFPNLRMRKK